MNCENLTPQKKFLHFFFDMKISQSKVQSFCCLSAFKKEAWAMLESALISTRFIFVCHVLNQNPAL